VQLKDALTAAIHRLTDSQVGSPRMNAEVLLMFTLDGDRAFLYAHPERELTAAEYARYEQVITQRASGIPSQYITGHQEFWGMDLIVTPAVLIPRPETEHVIEAVLEIRASDLGRQASGSGIRIVDVGTGSGCIALALAKEIPDAEIHATDISPDALEIAEANAARHQLGKRIIFHDTDLLEGLEEQGFDLVVSNPPYVGESEEDQVQLEVRKFEPRNAVFAGPTGLEVIERLVQQAKTLRPGGWLVMEISGTIAAGVERLLSDWQGMRITNDLQGIPRVARARNV
jgi:release factor glutamine methyltransferase